MRYPKAKGYYPITGTFFVTLHGSAHDRRKQYRKIVKDYPGAVVKKESNHVTEQRINGVDCVIEDANCVYSRVRVILPTPGIGG